MKLWTNIKGLDSKFSWSFLGFLIGVIGFGYAFYIENIKKEYSEISYEILSNTNVLDLNEKVGNLEVIYNDENILQTNRNLKVLTVRVINTGTKHINQDDYDQTQNWGFKIKNATIVNTPELISSTNDYLKSSLADIEIDTLNRVFLPKVIIEPQESFTLKVLTISKSNANTSISPFGKIAGINKFKVLKNERKEKELSYWEKLTLGNFGIHALRFFLYIICVIIFGLFFSLLVSSVNDFFEKKKIKKHIKKYKNNTKLEVDENMNKVFEIYKDYKESFIKKSQSILSKEDILKTIINLNEIQEKKLTLIKSEDNELFEPYRREFINETYESYPLNDFVIKKLQEFSVIKINENNAVTINHDFVKVLNDFVYFLKLQ